MTEDEGDVLWEPNCTYDLEPFQIKNAGNLALKYKVTLKATKIDKAADGDTIMLTGDVDISGETVSVDKDLTIKGEDTTLQNAYLEVADGKELSFDGVTIADTTTIRTKDDADLTFTNCEFNVTPEKKNNNSRAAAIIGNHQYSNVNLTLQGCTFNYQPCGGADSKRHEPKARAFCFAFLTGCPPQSRRDPFSAALGSTGASLPR